MSKKKLAVVGSGIAGMSAAYFLQHDYDVTLFEKQGRIGGHTNTIDVNDGVNDCPMDTGFMVYNDVTYPNLIKLFALLGVETKDTDMSFSVRVDDKDLEYNGSNIDGIYSQRKNIFNPKFHALIWNILKFAKVSKKDLEAGISDDLGLYDYCKGHGLSDDFFFQFLMPMSSAVWSTPPHKIRTFPAKALIRFFCNHGFVGVNTQLQWRTVVGGSRQYRDKILEQTCSQVIKSSPVVSAKPLVGKVELKFEDGTTGEFDRVVFACHADETYSIVKENFPQHEKLLKNFSYQKNKAIVHTDESVMPKLKKNWSSWNFIKRDDDTFTVYYMNRLQGVSKKQDFFINIEGERFVDPSKIIQTIDYDHPVFTTQAVKAQKFIDGLNRENLISLCGSYYRYGFHEDALLSSVNLCEILLERQVW